MRATELRTQIFLKLSDFPLDMLDSLEFCPLVDHMMLQEGCSKKNPVVFEQFQNDFCPSRDKVTECAMIL